MLKQCDMTTQASCILETISIDLIATDPPYFMG